MAFAIGTSGDSKRYTNVGTCIRSKFADSSAPLVCDNITSNSFITKALAKQSFRFHKEVIVRQISARVDLLSHSATTNAYQGAAFRHTCVSVCLPAKVSHCIKSRQDIEWRQDNQTCITLRGAKTIVVKYTSLQRQWEDPSASVLGMCLRRRVLE